MYCEDQKIKKLLDWVVSNGGSIKLLLKQTMMESEAFILQGRLILILKRENSDKEKLTQVSLIKYDESDVILKIPNKLLITPYHVSNREF
jgi:hypothetical protein